MLKCRRFLRRVVIVFNVFPVRPENQGALVETIRTAGDPAGVPDPVGP